MVVGLNATLIVHFAPGRDTAATSVCPTKLTGHGDTSDGQDSKAGVGERYLLSLTGSENHLG
jgi:hypothetical protein